MMHQKRKVTPTMILIQSAHPQIKYLIHKAKTKKTPQDVTRIKFLILAKTNLEVLKRNNTTQLHFIAKLMVDTVNITISVY